MEVKTGIRKTYASICWHSSSRKNMHKTPSNNCRCYVPRHVAIEIEVELLWISLLRQRLVGHHRHSAKVLPDQTESSDADHLSTKAMARFLNGFQAAGKKKKLLSKLCFVGN